MSNTELELSVFPPEALVEAVALGNPSDSGDSSRVWAPVRTAPKISSFAVEEMWGSHPAPDDGATFFIIDADSRVFGSGAAVAICYDRNNEVLECAENAALDDSGQGLDQETIDVILGRVQTKAGCKTEITFRTLPDGSLHIDTSLDPFHGNPEALSNPVPLPSVPLASLQRTHCFMDATHIFVVRTLLSPPSDVGVFKTTFEMVPSNLVETVEFMARLPDVDFLLRPTHMVVDEANRLHGFLTPHHPASSLGLAFRSLHPDSTPPVLPPYSADRSSFALTGITPSVTWPVKLAWGIDVAASVAWLHEQGIFWGDLKLDNIVLCTDGHCRLIDYFPGDQTSGWCPPEHMTTPSAEGDVFALGLTLWAIVVEVSSFVREEDYARPLLLWPEGTPQLFQSLVSACLEHDPGQRPSARRVYDVLQVSA